jgi:hypothetical protein
MLRTTGHSPLDAGEEVAIPARPLPNHLSLEHLRKEAKRFRAAVHAGANDALDALREFHLRADRAAARFTLADEPDLAGTNIYTAAAAGDVATVGAMLHRDRALLNRKGGPFNWEPLLYACYSRVPPEDGGRSTLEVARLLLSRGADPNAGFLFEGS